MALSFHKLTPADRRIVVVGTTGSGKTTMAQLLTEHLELPHIEMDALYWEAGWQGVSDEILQSRVDAATSREGWVLDGNYSRVQDIVWPRATTLIWLDYRLPLILWRLTKRTLQRGITREELWNGNKENPLRHFIPSESLFVWAFKSRAKHHRVYPKKINQTEYQHLNVSRLQTPRQTRDWLQANFA